MLAAMQMKNFELFEDSKSDDEESRPSSSQTSIVSLLEWLKSLISADNLQKRRAKPMPLSLCVFSGKI